MTLYRHLVPLGPALLVAIPAVYGARAIRLEGDFCLNTTFCTSNFVHLTGRAIVSTTAASIVSLVVHNNNVL